MRWGLIYNLKVTTSGSSGMIFLLKFQVASYSNLDKIDIGVYIVTTSNFQKKTLEEPMAIISNFLLLEE